MDCLVRRCVAGWWAFVGGVMMLSYALAAQPAGPTSAAPQPVTPQPVAPEPAAPIGTWRTHFSYANVQHLAITPQRVYGAANSGLFYVSKSDNSLQLLSKNDGLSDVGVVALSYSPSLDALMLAYRSGRIDVLADGQVVSFTLIQEANQEQKEVIYAIHWDGATAYVSTSQGVRILTVATEETLSVRIQESYTRLSATGDPLAIYSATTTADSLFLATEAGVIANALSPTVNRQDFATWRRFGPAEGLPSGETRHITQRAGVVYAAFDNVGLFRYQSGTWQATALTTTQAFNAVRATATVLTATLADQVALLNEQDQVILIRDALVSAPQDAWADGQGVVWIADQNNGLLRSTDGAFASFLPNGPPSDAIAGIRFVNQRIVALGADLSGVFSVFNEGQWATFRPPTDAQLLDILFSPITNTYYLASFGDGLLQWDGGQTFAAVPDPTSNTTDDQLTSLAPQDNRLWISRFGATAPLRSFLPNEDSWTDFSVVPNTTPYLRKVVVDFSGYKWLLAGSQSGPDQAGNDILIFDEQENRVQSVRQNVNSGDLPGDQLIDLVVDRDGLVWIGGNQGVAYFPNPFGIFSDVIAVRPVFNRQFLLRDEYVICLAVDGGNRKWVGTRNGLWLFSETGEELIHHFTVANSPLVSNTILDIAINGIDGEVFIATDQGVVSYRGTATQGSPQHQSVKVFPNPIRRGFDGTVGIQGLASDATVKITTISGVLVQELQAQGGTATWDSRNYAGQYVSNGVYLLFSATADGEETYIGKLAVVP